MDIETRAMVFIGTAHLGNPTEEDLSLPGCSLMPFASSCSDICYDGILIPNDCTANSPASVPTIESRSELREGIQKKFAIAVLCVSFAFDGDASHHGLPVTPDLSG